MKKVCLRIGNIRIHIFKNKKEKKERKEKKTQLIPPSRLKEKPDLEMEWLTFGVVWRELLQAVFVQNV